MLQTEILITYEVESSVFTLQFYSGTIDLKVETNNKINSHTIAMLFVKNKNTIFVN